MAGGLALGTARPWPLPGDKGYPNELKAGVASVFINAVVALCVARKVASALGWTGDDIDYDDISVTAKVYRAAGSSQLPDKAGL